MKLVAVAGSPGEILVREAEGAALLVVGSIGRSQLAGMLGSVALHCVVHAHCPVMVVHPDPDRSAAAAAGAVRGRVRLHGSMQAWVVDGPSPSGEGPLRRVERDTPQAEGREVRFDVSGCGACRTDLHLEERDPTPVGHG